MDAMDNRTVMYVAFIIAGLALGLAIGFII